MIEKFPLYMSNKELQVDDYYVFSASFAEILLRHIPTVKEVHFCHDEEGFLAIDEAFATDSSSIEKFSELYRGDSYYLIINRFILLALPATDGVVVAVLSGADALVIQKISRDWLAEKIDQAEREFHLLKQARVDSQTGLLNLTNLAGVLEKVDENSNLLLTLVELKPSSTSFRHNTVYTHHCLTLLKSFVRGRSILHYLGHNVFALVLQRDGRGSISTLESNLVAYLKKAGCPRVHVGSSSTHFHDISRFKEKAGSTLLDEAYTALHKAGRRGPFSFCEYQAIAYPENQPLAAPPSSVVRRISNWGRDLDSFALVLFRGDNEQSSAVSAVGPTLKELRTIEDGEDLYVFYPEGDKELVCQRVEEIIAKAKGTGDGVQISAGIAIYPYADRKKSELPFNCKKALIHAEFFGPSSLAVFDHLTLNISGDVYFAEGDFTQAIKEYRRGLTSCGGDVNLYNSLGVTLALMNRTSQAITCFKEALEIDSCDFMALYNLGLSKQSLKLYDKAVDYFAKAYEVCMSDEVDLKLIRELRLELGILSCKTGRYPSALAYINEWLEEFGESPESGRLHYYQGFSHFKLGNSREAMKSFERALRFNGFDDRSLSLLGRLYLQEGESETIAETYCLKSVELNPDKLEYKLYLAEVYVSTHKLVEARALLKPCLRRKAIKAYAQLLMGESYLKEEQPKRAEAWLRKVLLHKDLDAQLKERARQGLKLSVV